MRGRIRHPLNLSRKLLKFEPNLPQNLLCTSGPAVPILCSRHYFGSIPTKEVNLRSDALVYAAQEAERSILALRLAKESSPTTSDHAHGVDETLRAAERLLAVSRPPTNLVEVISEQQNSPQYATLHRVFLQVISRLLDHAHATALLDHRVAVLQTSLLMARRIHELGLPMHLPLHQRLVHSFAKWGTLLMEESPARLVLEAASWSPFVTADTFNVSLCCLIESRQFADAAELLKGMRVDYKLERMEIPDVRDVLVALESAVNTVMTEQSSEQLDSPPISTLQVVQTIVWSLEFFVQYIFQEETIGLDQLERLDHLDEDQATALSKQVLSNTEEDSIHNDKREEHRFTTMDDADKSLAVHSVLLSGVMDTKVRALMAALLDRTRPAAGTDDSKRNNNNKRFRSLGSIVDAQNHQVFEAYAVVHDGSDSDWSDSDRTLLPMDMIYSRHNVYEFPDVTGQLVALNKGKAIFFTEEYERLLWARDYEEEMDMFADSMVPDDSDDSDDSDDDDGSGNSDF